MRDYGTNDLNDKVEEYKEVKKMAPQDIPRDPSLLPKEIVTITDAQIARLFRGAGGVKPRPNVVGDMVFILHEEYSDKQAQFIIDSMWPMIREGYSLFIDPDFPAKPDVKPEHRKVEGFKKYTK